ncbi:ABC transporter permease [Candidiatus Paracoxiella cheracis]|uniref:ABC transporter permease n=1 Tax=Candidiatus Paracoxiella cheracis TaxID=3405120 RepID=UPI003BF5E633
MDTKKKASDAKIALSEDKTHLHLSGNWTIAGITAVAPTIQTLVKKAGQDVTIDGSAIAIMDSAGALLIENIIVNFKKLGKQATVSGISERFQSLLKLVTDEIDLVRNPPPPPETPSLLYTIGEKSYFKWRVVYEFMEFVGEMFIGIVRSIRQPSRFQWRLILRFIDDTGYRALPIVALLTFLVGIVLTYQIAVQLSEYNADIFIVDLTGMVILREFGPLITAIIAAGRTSTSFTAQIGTMKINEEIDALNTMGVSPIERLVMPKVLGLVIALPLLTVWADIFGVLGSMVMSKAQLGISYYSFLERFQHSVAVKDYIVGLVKAPVFALIIAAVGCFQGFQVSGTADDVGRKTTQSAVQSIFLIIIADALFSILFSWRGV